MLTNQPPTDISYIADALLRIDDHLHVATVHPHRSEQDKALVMAIKTGCAALTRLREDDEVWSRLRALHEELQQWQRLQVPIVASLFTALGHGSAEPTETLIRTANELLQEAAGFPARRGKDPVTRAQNLVEQLRDQTCNLTTWAERKRWRKDTGGRILKFLGGVLVGVAAAEADAGVRDIAPHVLRLLEELTERIGQALPPLSMGALIAGTELARQDIGDFSQADDDLRSDPGRTHDEKSPVDSQDVDVPDRGEPIERPPEVPDRPPESGLDLEGR